MPPPSSDPSLSVYHLYDGSLPVCEMDNQSNLLAVNTFGANGILSRHTTYDQ